MLYPEWTRESGDVVVGCAMLGATRPSKSDCVDFCASRSKHVNQCFGDATSILVEVSEQHGGDGSTSGGD